MDYKLETLETRFFEKFDASEVDEDPPCAFLLASPRTGSTLTYQILSHCLPFSYLSNLVNEHFPEHPIVGAVLHASLDASVEPDFQSEYGKTEGILQPSEASYLLQNWFGGGHPSQIESTEFRDGMETHMRRTLAAVRELTGRPPVVKNAWNSFRTEALARAFPNAFFVWVRRDVADAASSHLETRYTLEGSPEAWNSATPANVEELRQRPYWEQVVENQVEFNKAIGNGLEEHAPDRHLELWYEDLCRDTGDTLDRLEAALDDFLDHEVRFDPDTDPVIERSQPSLNKTDAQRVREYVSEEGSRLDSYRYGS